jgi:hypothetical protein
MEPLRQAHTIGLYSGLIVYLTRALAAKHIAKRRTCLTVMGIIAVLGSIASSLDTRQREFDNFVNPETVSQAHGRQKGKNIQQAGFPDGHPL